MSDGDKIKIKQSKGIENIYGRQTGVTILRKMAEEEKTHRENGI